MGVKIFRDDNWKRITSGDISSRDIMHLDREKDRELIGYLITHAPDECDAYSYRTYGCGILPGVTTEDIREFCRLMIVERGPFRDVAGIYLNDQ